MRDFYVVKTILSMFREYIRLRQCLCKLKLIIGMLLYIPGVIAEVRETQRRPDSLFGILWVLNYSHLH